MLIEKPLGIGNEEINNLKTLERLSSKNVIRIGYVLRYEPGYKLIKKWIADSSIGMIISSNIYCGSWLPDWRKDKNYKDSVSSNRELGGGVIRELSHEIDLINQLFGEINIVSSILGNSNSLNIDVEDKVVFLAKNKKNIFITCQLDFCSFPPKRFIIIRGTQGEIYWNLIENKISLKVKNKVEIKKIFNHSTDEKYIIQLKNFFYDCENNNFTKIYYKQALEVLKIINKLDVKR